MGIIRIALAIDVLLTAIHHLSPDLTGNVLPLGGDPFVQLAVLLLIAVAATEMYSNRKRKK